MIVFFLSTCHICFSSYFSHWVVFIHFVPITSLQFFSLVLHLLISVETQIAARYSPFFKFFFLSLLLRKSAIFQIACAGNFFCFFL